MNPIHTGHLIANLDHQPSINRLLWALGHFHEVDANGFVCNEITEDEICDLSATAWAVVRAVVSYQRFRPGLKTDGAFGPMTLHASHAELGYRCGCPDLMRRPAALAEWPPTCQDKVTTGHNLDSLRIDFGDNRTIDDAWLYAIDQWNEACGVKLTVVGYDDDPRIQAKAGSMGSGTLAWSFLANGSCESRLNQEYNRSVLWDWQKACGVICHEVGHALGLPHTSQAGNIMQPYYSPEVTKLGPWDIDQVNNRRYGPPVAAPPLPPDDDDAYGILRWYNAKGKPTGRRHDVVRGATVPAE